MIVDNNMSYHGVTSDTFKTSKTRVVSKNWDVFGTEYFKLQPWVDELLTVLSPRTLDEKIQQIHYDYINSGTALH